MSFVACVFSAMNRRCQSLSPAPILKGDGQRGQPTQVAHDAPGNGVTRHIEPRIRHPPQQRREGDVPFQTGKWRSYRYFVDKGISPLGEETQAYFSRLTNPMVVYLQRRANFDLSPVHKLPVVLRSLNAVIKRVSL